MLAPREGWEGTVLKDVWALQIKGLNQNKKLQKGHFLGKKTQNIKKKNILLNRLSYGMAFQSMIFFCDVVLQEIEGALAGSKRLHMHGGCSSKARARHSCIVLL